MCTSGVWLPFRMNKKRAHLIESIWFRLKGHRSNEWKQSWCFMRKYLHLVRWFYWLKEVTHSTKSCPTITEFPQSSQKRTNGKIRFVSSLLQMAFHQTTLNVHIYWAYCFRAYFVSSFFSLRYFASRRFHKTHIDARSSSST